MKLLLSQLPASLRGPEGDDYRGTVPARMRFLAPDAAASLIKIEFDTAGLTYTDLFRDALSSLAAHQCKAGVMPPA